MGANNSTRRVSFESDENENITVVKGIRLSENVIKRMKEPPAPPKPQSPTLPPSMAPTLTPSPPLMPVPPLVDPITSFTPLSPVEPVVPPSPPQSVPLATEMAAPPPQPPSEQVAAPTIADLVLPSLSPLAPANAAAFEPVATPPPPPPAVVDPVTLPISLPPPASAPIEPLTPAPCPAPAVVEVIAPLTPAAESSPPPINEPSASPLIIPPIAPTLMIESLASSSVFESISPPSVQTEPIASPSLAESEPHPSPPVFESVTILPASAPPPGEPLSMQPAEQFAAPPLPEFTAPFELAAPPPQPTVEPLTPAPVPKPEPVPESSPVPPLTVEPTVDEEALRRKITDELYKGLEQDRAKAEQEMQAWFDAEKARTSAQAKADVQTQVRAEVSRILSAERAAAPDGLQEAIIRERISTEDERLRAQLFAKQLEAREADLKKQDAFYREQVARLEDRSTQFYKVTTENYHKAADEVNAKFKRYEMYPVCPDLQGQILACYKENVGKTLNCSNIAALYLQCVNNAKQNKLRTGG
ncbi:coiled-coil-helix-coiled-coil-helix domain containing 3a isoform 4-T4 [Menidia menidia]